MSEQDTTQETEAVETVEDEQNPTQEAEESPEDDRNDAWDPERARRKIAKVNSENRTLRERATKAEQKASSVDDLTAANLRLEVGYELGLPLAIAKRLQGSTREEMLADAEALVDLVSPARRAPSSTRPAERVRGGGEPDEAPEPDLSKIAADIPRR